MPRLYDLAEQYRNLEEVLENITAFDVEEGMTQEVIAAEIKNNLDAIQGDINDKVQSIAKILIEMDGDIDSFKAEEKRLATRRKARENNREHLFNYLDTLLRSLNIERVDGIVPVKYGKCAPSVEENSNEPKDRRKEFWRKKDPEPDKKAILAALKEGRKVKGWRLVTDKKTLRIG